MTHTVITSFSTQGYEDYGAAFIQQFAKHWPAEVRLVIFHEWSPEQFDAMDRPGYRDNIEWRPVADAPHHDEWAMWIRRRALLTGRLGNGGYDINFDAGMCRKIWFQHAGIKFYGGKVFWVDSDVYTHADVPQEFLDDVLPDDKLCCYLGRERIYTESGFLGFNADHKFCVPFFHLYQSIPLTGAIFTLPGWHDCYAFDAARSASPKNAAGEIETAYAESFVNLGAGLGDGGPGLQVFNSSILGAYMDHRKGARKGKPSPHDEMSVRRTEPYWQRDEPPVTLPAGLYEDHGPSAGESGDVWLQTR